MSKKVIEKSIWKKKMPDGEILRCHVISTTVDNSTDLQFHFHGWNPFPCKTMVSTWHVVQEWLENNGWNQLLNPVTTVIVEKDKELEIADSPELPEDPEYLYISRVTGELGNFLYWHRQYEENKSRGLLDDTMRFSKWFWGMLYTHTIEPYA